MKIRKIKYFFSYMAAKVFIALLSVIPRHRHAAAAKVIAGIGGCIPQFGKIAEQNVRAAYPEYSQEECSRIARASLCHLAQLALEFLRLRKHPEEFPHENVLMSAETEQLFTGLKKTGQQVIFITPHHGSWEYAGLFLATFFRFRMATVMKPPRNPWLCKFAIESRGVDGVRLIFSKGAVRALQKALAEGFSVGLLSDQNTRVREGGEFVNFFDLPVPVTSMPARLSFMHGLPLVIGTMQRLMDGKFRLHAVKIDPSEEPDASALTRRMIAEVEKIVRTCPEQYLWIYRRFQYIPDQVPSELEKRYPPYAKHAPPSFYDHRARNSAGKH